LAQARFQTRSLTRARVLLKQKRRYESSHRRFFYFQLDQALPVIDLLQSQRWLTV
jgi:hypothetical protein